MGPKLIKSDQPQQVERNKKIKYRPRHETERSLRRRTRKSVVNNYVQIKEEKIKSNTGKGKRILLVLCGTTNEGKRNKKKSVYFLFLLLFGRRQLNYITMCISNLTYIYRVSQNTASEL